MNVRWHNLYLLTLALCAIGGGCATPPDTGTALSKAETRGKGHWVTLPPQTGSFVPRQVWVDENGKVDAAPSASNLQTGSASMLEKTQRGSSGAGSRGP